MNDADGCASHEGLPCEQSESITIKIDDAFQLSSFDFELEIPQSQAFWNWPVNHEISGNQSVFSHWANAPPLTLSGKDILLRHQVSRC